MKKFSFLFTGLLISSLTLGFLTGLSDSPVFGIVLTSIIGLLGTVAVIILDKRIKLSGQSLLGIMARKANFIGSIMIFSSLTFVAGIFLGSMLRWEFQSLRTRKEFPWTETTKPANGYEAIDWINVKDILESRGYSAKQVVYLYNLSRNDSTGEDYFNYDVNVLYSNILKGPNIRLPEPDTRSMLRSPMRW